MARMRENSPEGVDPSLRRWVQFGGNGGQRRVPPGRARDISVGRQTLAHPTERSQLSARASALTHFDETASGQVRLHRGDASRRDSLCSGIQMVNVGGTSFRQYGGDSRKKAGARRGIEDRSMIRSATVDSRARKTAIVRHHHRETGSRRSKAIANSRGQDRARLEFAGMKRDHSGQTPQRDPLPES